MRGVEHGGVARATALLIAVTLLAVAPAGSAGAAPRDEAKRAFHNGMRLIEEGQLEAGIAELELAYEILPHPHVLFNIGRAYLEAGRTGDAVRYLRLYLESEPPDADEVRQVLINEAQRHYDEGMLLVREGSIEEGIDRLETAYWILPRASVLYNIGRAFVEVDRPDRAIAYFERYLETNPPDHFEVRQLIIRLRREAEAEEIYGEPEEPATAELPPEQLDELRDLAERMERAWERHETRPLARPVPATGEESAADGRTTEEILAGRTIEDIYEEQVVSASRQVTSPLDAPVSTHIITAEDIRMSGVTSIPELLRMVPGVEVMQMGPANFNVAIRGFNQRMANKVLVLIDGRSIYFDFLFETTFWKTMEVNLLDIERIEVIRGPGATLYGANAFSGVVNIITKPRGEKSLQIGGLTGMGETTLGEVRYSDRIKTVGYSVSVGYEQTDRFELEYGTDRRDVVYVVSDPTLALRSLRANGGISWLPRDDTTLSISGGIATVYWDWVAMGLLRGFYITGFLPHVRVDLRHKGFGLRVFWNHLDLPEAGPPSYQLGSLDTLYTSGITDVVDVEATYSGDLELGVVHQFAGSVGFRAKNVRDFGFLDDDHFERHLNGSIEDTIQFARWMRAVLGFRFDVHPLVGFTPSPRVALIVKPTQRMAIRASAGTSFRIPSFIESYMDLPVPGPATGVVILSRGSVDLKPEQLRSIELGYRFEGSDYLMFDVAGYYQRVNDLIALGAVETTPDYGMQDEYFVGGVTGFTNVDQPFGGFGVEPSLHLFPVRGLDISVNYAFNYLVDLEKYRAGEEARDRRGPLHKFNAGVQYRSPFHLDFHVWCHVVGAYSIPERSFRDTGEVYVEEYDIDPFVILNARVVAMLLEDKLEFGVTIQNLTGFFDEDGGHREHLLGTTIRPRVFGTLRVSF